MENLKVLLRACIIEQIFRNRIDLKIESLIQIGITQWRFTTLIVIQGKRGKQISQLTKTFPSVGWDNVEGITYRGTRSFCCRPFGSKKSSFRDIPLQTTVPNKLKKFFAGA
jgi:hypothetical protein